MTITVAPVQEITRLKTMANLREIFPTPETVNDLNLVMFSTSGIHGSYTTIETIEKILSEGKNAETEDWFDEESDPDPTEYRLTVLVLHPRCVTMRFGSIPVTLADIPYLKELRARSQAVMAQIGNG